MVAGLRLRMDAYLEGGSIGWALSRAYSLIDFASPPENVFPFITIIN